MYYLIKLTRMVNLLLMTPYNNIKLFFVSSWRVVMNFFRPADFAWLGSCAIADYSLARYNKFLAEFMLLKDLSRFEKLILWLERWFYSTNHKRISHLYFFLG